jgi:hypothetical protein
MPPCLHMRVLEGGGWICQDGMSCDGVCKFKRRASQTHIRRFLVPRLGGEGEGTPLCAYFDRLLRFVLCRRRLLVLIMVCDE